MFFYEEQDIVQDTVKNSVLTSIDIANTSAVELQQKFNDYIAFQEKNGFQIMNSINIDKTRMDALLNNLNLQESRVAYFSHLAKTEGITYDYFNAKYTFHDTIVKGDYAVTNVSEDLDYQYSFCDEPTYEGFTYNISLIKLDGVWKISKVISNDPFFIENYNRGFDLVTELQGYDEAIAQKEVPSQLIDTASSIAVHTASNISYKKQNAINYALTYSSSYDDDTFVKPDWANSNMPWLNANCMNFVSQCIWAGFGGSNSSTDIAAYYGMDRVGTEANRWYTNGSSASSSWGSCSAFKTYVDTAASSTEKGLVCNRKSVSYSLNQLPYTADSMKGAAIQTKGYNSNGAPVSLGHVVFINNATGSTRNSIYFTSYNRNWKNKLFSQRYPASTTDTYAGLYVIVPTSFRNGEDGTRLWADLHNALPSGTSVPIKGYANTQCTTINLKIYNPSGSLVKNQNFSNTSTITSSYICNGTGAWRFVLTGTDSSNTVKSFTYMVRIY